MLTAYLRTNSFRRRRQEDKLRYVTAGLDVIDNPVREVCRECRHVLKIVV